MDTIHENEMKKTNINSKLKNIPSKAVSLCRKKLKFKYNISKYLVKLKENPLYTFVIIDLYLKIIEQIKVKKY